MLNWNDRESIKEFIKQNNIKDIIQLNNVIDAVYNISEDGIRRAIAEITSGKGFDLVAECAGVEGAFDTCVELVRVGGTVYAYGWHVHPETISPYNWHTKHFKLLSNAWVAHNPFDTERFKHMSEIAIKWLERGLWRVNPLIKGITSIAIIVQVLL
ncbi:MAG: L-iditol 2-dehydrogenase [Candidatus Poribacteria bacterium]|nr:L-iditol 2-dehydrogenase [Candidatus Poribacteria bacterium]